jgi:hypothetical protein
MVTDELQKGARAKVRIEDRHVPSALRLSPPPCPEQSYTRLAVGSIPQLDQLSKLSGYFPSVFTVDPRFPARCCKYSSASRLRNSLIFVRRQASTAPRFRLSPPDASLTPYLLLPFGRLGGFATCCFRGNRTIRRTHWRGSAALRCSGIG